MGKSESIKVLDIEQLCYAIKDNIEPFCLEYNVEDMRAISQNVWNAFLTITGNTVIKPNREIIYNTALQRYRIDTLEILCDFYITLCESYEKEVSIVGFSKLTSISQDIINEWASNTYLYTITDENGRVLTFNPFGIYKKLHDGREESLSNMLISGKRNPVGILGALNHRYGWNNQPQVLEVRQSALVDRSALGIAGQTTQEETITPPGTDTDTSKP